VNCGFSVKLAVASLMLLMIVYMCRCWKRGMTTQRSGKRY